MNTDYEDVLFKPNCRWAYEIHSSFLVPCAPLQLPNLDSSIATHIDTMLTGEAAERPALPAAGLRDAGHAAWQRKVPGAVARGRVKKECSTM